MRQFISLAFLISFLIGCAGERSISYNFAERLDRAAVLHEQNYLDIGSPGAEHSLVRGWGSPEREADITSVRTVGELAEIEALVTALPVQEVSFTCRPLGPSTSTTQSITLVVNGRFGGKVDLRPGFNRYTVDLEPETLVIGRNRVQLHLNQPAIFDDFAFGGVQPPAPSEAPREEPRQEGGNFHQPAGTEVAFPLYLPQKAKLEFYATVAGDHPEAEVNTEVALRRRDGLEAVVHSRRYKGSVGSGHTVDLTGHGQDLVEVVFQVTADARLPELGVVWRTPSLTGASNEAFETNILLLVVDTLRADHLGCYGGQPKTPNLDALAARGITFENAYSHIPITGPAHSSMFTSLMPSQHGVLVNTNILHQRHFTLAEAMGALHHRTAGFVSLGTLSGQYGMAQGFDLYKDQFRFVGWKTAQQVNEEVLPWLAALGDDSFFLMVHYSDPHEPYASPDGVFPTGEITLNGELAGNFAVDGTPVRVPLKLQPGENRVRLATPDGFSLRGHSISGDAKLEFAEGWKLIEYQGKVFEATTEAAGTFRITNQQKNLQEQELRYFSYERTTPEVVRPRYIEEVEYLDRHIGQLFDELERRGLLDNTLVLFTSDHGEGLGDHGHIGHVSQLYDTLTRVPLILSFPGRLPVGQRITAPASHIDLFPTILDFLGVKAELRMEGVSLLDAIQGSDQAPRRILAETHRPEAPFELRSVLEGDYKYIWDETRSRGELYDVKRDPDELDNLLPRSSAIAAKLREKLDADFARLRTEDPHAPQTPRLSEAEIERLRALGYLR